MADNYPSKPIRIISPSPPGGGTDAMSRLVASRLTETANWQVFVENVPGAGNNIGLRAGARAAPDGYTLVMGETSNLAVNPYLYKSLDFSAVDDLVPVALMGSGPLVLVVRTGSRFDSLASIIQAGKKSDLFYASSGSGTVGHLVAESLRDATGIKLQHIPFKGSADGMQAVLGGHVMSHSDATGWGPHVDAGTCRLLATYGSKRTKRWPNVPTLQELGYETLADSPFGIGGPKGMPAALTSRLHDAFKKTLEDPAVLASFDKYDQSVIYMNTADYTKFIAETYVKEKTIIEKLGLAMKT